MQISEQTIKILSNFAGINNNLLLKPGNEFSTMSIGQTVISKATVPETFPIEFGIYDLGEFLGVLSLFKEPDLNFQDQFVEIKSANKLVRYFKAEPVMLKYPRKLKIPETWGLEFKITQADINSVLKTARVLHSEDVSIVGDGQTLKVVVGNTNNATSNKFELNLGETDKKFNMIIKTDDLKFLPSDFTVFMYAEGMIRFVTDNLIYYVMADANSKLEGLK